MFIPYIYSKTIGHICDVNVLFTKLCSYFVIGQKTANWTALGLI